MRSKSYYDDLIGQKFGLLVVVGYAAPKAQSNGRNKVIAKYKCDCGKEGIMILTSLVNRSQSCGCLRAGNIKSHGMSGSRLYHIWAGMMDRCNNPNNRRYKDYGGRGIKVYKRWEDNNIFFKWAINNGYKDELTLERNNVNGNYTPFNCSWKTMLEQSRNTRSNFNIEINGITKCLSEWCEHFNVNYKRTHSRIKRGWRIDENIFK